MKLIYTLSIALLIFLGTTTNYAQSNTQTKGDKSTPTEEITEVMDAYWVATQAADWNTVLDFMYPKLYDHVPREAMLQAMESMGEAEVKIGFKNMNIKKISKPMKYESEKFAMIDYGLIMSMSFPVEEDDASQEQHNIFMLSMLQAQYGVENVELDIETKAIDIKLNNSMYAISSLNDSDWKVLENKTNQKALLDMLIPKKVQKAFK